MGALRLLARRVRRAADQLLFVAADVPDLLGQAALGRSEHIQHAVHDAHGACRSITTIRPRRKMPATTSRTTRRMPHHGDGTGGYHPHESPWSMLVPLVVLSLGAVFAGLRVPPRVHRAERRASGTGAIAFNEHLMHAMHEVPLWVKLTATIVMLIGLLDRLARPISATPAFPARVADAASARSTASCSTSGISTSSTTSCSCARRSALGRLFWKRGDEGIDRPLRPQRRGLGWSQAARRRRARLQSGYLYTYALVMLLGLVARGHLGDAR